MDVFNALARFRVKERVSLSSICVLRTFAPTVLFAHSVETLVLVFHCIAVFKQSPPSLHRQHYRAV